MNQKNNSNNPLCSVICPVYNTNPEYLKICIDSVLNQTFQDFELLLIDDMSTNQDTLNLLEKYNNENSNECLKIVLSEQNQGISSARNKGMNIAKGRYITFIDHDDFYKDDFLQIMTNGIIENDFDFVGCSYSQLENGIETPIHLYLEEYYNHDKVILQDENVWQRLYKRELLMSNRILFPDGKLAEDIIFSEKVNIAAKKCKKIPYVGYVHVNHIANTSRSDSYHQLGVAKSPLNELENIAIRFNIDTADWKINDRENMKWQCFVDIVVIAWIYSCKASRNERKKIAKWCTEIVNNYYIDININPNYIRRKVAGTSSNTAVWIMAHLFYFGAKSGFMEFITIVVTSIIAAYLK